MSEEPREPTEEELRAALEEQMRRITVRDVLLQTVITLVNLSARKLGLVEGEAKDLEQARTGIDAVRALLPLLPDEDTAPVKDALSQLQMAYAKEAGPSPESPVTSHESPEKDAEREKARAKIWTPPGS